METIVYISRHSLKDKTIINNGSDSFNVRDQKMILTIEGERRAEELSNLPELQNIDYVFSSNYARTMATAKYVADKNNKKIEIVEEFGERLIGIKNGERYAPDYEQKQVDDENYRIRDGESQLDVVGRFTNALLNLVTKYEGSKMFIVSHATAMTFFLKNYCTIINNTMYYKDKIIMNDIFAWDSPDLFKITFSGKDIIDINHLKRN